MERPEWQGLGPIEPGIGPEEWQGLGPTEPGEPCGPVAEIKPCGPVAEICDPLAVQRQVPSASSTVWVATLAVVGVA